MHVYIHSSHLFLECICNQVVTCSRLILCQEAITSVMYTRSRTRCSYYVNWTPRYPITSTEHSHDPKYGAVLQYFLLTTSSRDIVERVALVQEYIDVSDEFDVARGYRRVSKGDLVVIQVGQILAKVIMFPASTTTGLFQSSADALSANSLPQHKHLPATGLIMDTWRKPDHYA
jgi:hypothetical protein